MGKKKIGFRDLDRDVLISAPRKIKIYEEGHWLMLSQDKVLQIITEKKYTGDTLRVLLFFIAVTDYDNRIKNFTQKKISEKIKISQSKVSLAIKALQADKIIYMPDDDEKMFYFSDDLLTKGTYKYLETEKSKKANLGGVHVDDIDPNQFGIEQDYGGNHE